MFLFQTSAKMVPNFSNKMLPCLFVYLMHRLQEFKIIPVNCRDCNKCFYIFWETAAAVAYPGIQETSPDPLVQSHAFQHKLDICANLFGKKCYCIGKGNFCGK